MSGSCPNASAVFKITGYTIANRTATAAEVSHHRPPDRTNARGGRHNRPTGTAPRLGQDCLGYRPIRYPASTPSTGLWPVAADHATPLSWIGLGVALTGEADYIFRVFCVDLSALNSLIQNVLLPHPFIGRVQSQIVMNQMKGDTALPLPRR